MSSELSYKDLSEWVYFLDGKHEQHFYMEVGHVRKYGGVQYKIIKVEDNITNGMQAMAVAPVKNNVVDTSEIVIAYAGKNTGDGLDIHKDYQTVVVGKQLDTTNYT